jgi:hypothetical protein
MPLCLRGKVLAYFIEMGGERQPIDLIRWLRHSPFRNLP